MSSPALSPVVYPENTGTVTVERKNFNETGIDIEVAPSWNPDEKWKWNATIQGTTYRWKLTPASGYRAVCVKAKVKRTENRYKHSTSTLLSTYISYEEITVYCSTNGEGYAPSSPFPDSGYIGYNQIQDSFDVYVDSDPWTYRDIRREVTTEVLNCYAIFAKTNEVFVNAVYTGKGDTYVGKKYGSTVRYNTIGEFFTIGSTAYLKATPASGWGFYKWDDNGSQNHTVSVTAEKAGERLVMTFSAEFRERNIHIYAFVWPGQEERGTAGASRDDCLYFYGETAYVWASPNDGYVTGTWYEEKPYGSTNWQPASETRFIARETRNFGVQFNAVWYIKVGAYNHSWLYHCPYTATVISSMDGPARWDGENSGSYYSGEIKVPAGGSASLSVSLHDTIPNFAEYTFEGWFTGSSLVSSSTSFTYNGSGHVTICPVYKVKMKCNIRFCRSLQYTSWSHSDNLKEDIQIGLDGTRMTMTGSGIGALTIKDGHYEVDITNSPINDYTDSEIKIYKDEPASNYVNFSAQKVYTNHLDTFDPQFGVNKFDEWLSTGVLFREYASIKIETKCYKHAVDKTVNRAEIYCIFNMGPYIDWRVTVSEGKSLYNAAIANKEETVFATSIYTQMDYQESATQIRSEEVCFKMLESYLVNNKYYRYRFPISAFAMMWADLVYAEGVSSESLSIRLLKNGVAESVVSRTTGNRTASIRFNGVSFRVDYDLSTFTKSDVLTIIMHIGTFWPLRNASGAILHNGSGAIMNDS